MVKIVIGVVCKIFLREREEEERDASHFLAVSYYASKDAFSKEISKHKQ